MVKTLDSHMTAPARAKVVASSSAKARRVANSGMSSYVWEEEILHHLKSPIQSLALVMKPPHPKQRRLPQSRMDVPPK